MPSRTVNQAALQNTQILASYGQAMEQSELLTYALPGSVTVKFRNNSCNDGVEVRMGLHDLDVLIGTLRAARKIVAK